MNFCWTDDGQLEQMLLPPVLKSSPVFVSSLSVAFNIVVPKFVIP